MHSSGQRDGLAGNANIPARRPIPRRFGPEARPRGYEGCLFEEMGTYASNTKLDQLTLVDGPDLGSPTAESPPTLKTPVNPELVLPSPAPVAPAPPVPKMGSTSTGETHDAFMAEALREFETGQVEQPLWVRSLAQSGGDVAVAKPAYLRARAVA